MLFRQTALHGDMRVIIVKLCDILRINFILDSNECLRDGEESSYDCLFAVMRGSFEWTGVGFNCYPMKNRIRLPLINTCPTNISQNKSVCGLYSAEILCNPGNMNQTSTLYFHANYTLMNDKSILCQNINGFPFRNITVRVGGIRNHHACIIRYNCEAFACHQNNYASVRMRKRGIQYIVCLCVCVDCYSCSRINEVQVRVSYRLLYIVMFI